MCPFLQHLSAFSQFSDAAELRATAKLFCVLSQPPNGAGKKLGAGLALGAFYGEIFKGRIAPAR